MAYFLKVKTTWPPKESNTNEREELYLNLDKVSSFTVKYTKDNFIKCIELHFGNMKHCVFNNNPKFDEVLKYFERIGSTLGSW